tara:strand:+ start:715 stop:957 length:243 start_codon:yes stop_codon:yes gene_type:complete
LCYNTVIKTKEKDMKKTKLRTVPAGITCGGYSHMAKLFIEASIRLTKEGEHKKAEEQREYAYKIMDEMAAKWSIAIGEDL